MLSAGALAACIWWPPLGAVMQTSAMPPIMLLPAVVFAAAVPLAAGILGMFIKKRR